MPSKGRREIKIASIGIVIFGIIFGYRFVYSERLAQLNALEQRIIDSSEKKLLLEAVSTAEERFSGYENVFFDSANPALLVDKIDKFARNAGLKINNIRPQAVEMKESYGIIPLQLELQGDYHQIGNFLSMVESHNRLIKITKLGLRRQTYRQPEDTVSLNARISLEGVFRTGN